MGNGFLKFKRYIVTETIVQTILIGVSAGLLPCALGLLLIKLGILPIQTMIPILVGIGVAIVAGITYFLLHLPTDMNIAKRLDRQLGLTEKVQTLVEYQGQTGDVTEVQRMDTEQILVSTPVKSIRKRSSIIPVILSILAIGLLVVTLMIPTVEPPPPVVEDPPFTLTPWQEQALQDLIKEVQESTMDQAPKDLVVAELEELLGVLRTVNKQSGMKSAVVGCIVAVDTIVNSHHTYPTIANLLKASDHAYVKAYGGAISALSALTLEEEMTAAKDELLAMETVVEMQLSLLTFCESLDSALEGYKGEATEPLYAALLAYAAGLKNIYDNMDGTAWPTQELTDLTSSTSTASTLALMQQYVNESMRQKVINRLMQIFGISKSDLPSSVNPNKPAGSGNGEDAEEFDPDKPLQSGGVSDGKVQYTANDLVYDPETNTYVVYGELLNSAYGEIVKLITQGELTDEEKKLVTQYFQLLFSSQPEEEQKPTE